MAFDSGLEVEKWLRMDSSVCGMGSHIGPTLRIYPGKPAKGRSGGHDTVQEGSSPFLKK